MQQYTAADPAALVAEVTTTATDCIMEAVIGQYGVRKASEEHEFVTTTTRQVVERFFYTAQTPCINVAKTVQQTTSMLGAARLPKEAPTFGASREVVQQQNHADGGTNPPPPPPLPPPRGGPQTGSYRYCNRSDSAMVCPTIAAPQLSWADYHRLLLAPPPPD